MSNNVMTANEVPQSINVGGFLVNSKEELELEQKYQMVRGHELQVKNSQGQIVYDHLRGFAPLSNEVHLLRYADGKWLLLYVSGKKKGKKNILKKTNLEHGKGVLYFDDRGKIHPDQSCPYCASIRA